MRFNIFDSEISTKSLMKVKHDLTPEIDWQQIYTQAMAEEISRNIDRQLLMSLLDMSE